MFGYIPTNTFLFILSLIILHIIISSLTPLLISWKNTILNVCEAMLYKNNNNKKNLCFLYGSFPCYISCRAALLVSCKYDITVGLSCKNISEHNTCFFLFYMEQCGHMSLKPTEIWQGTYRTSDSIQSCQTAASLNH